MTCAACRERIDELAGQELAPRRAAEMRAHLDACAACSRILSQTQATLSLLRRLGDEEPPADFASSLHLKLAAVGAPPRPGFLTRARDYVGELLALRPQAAGAVGVALAAAVVALVLVGRGATTPTGADRIASAGEVSPIFVVPRAKVAVVRIDFVAEQDIEDVEFAIALPEGLHFVSEGRELPDREFRWRGKLGRGSNPIPVAVRGARAGRYTLAAHAVGHDVDASQNVVLEVTAG